MIPFKYLSSSLLLERFQSFARDFSEKKIYAPLLLKEQNSFSQDWLLGYRHSSPPWGGNPFGAIKLFHRRKTVCYSFSFCFNWIFADFCKISKEKVTLIIKSHKTARSYGTVALELTGVLQRLFKTWLKNYRSCLLRPGVKDAKDLFINPASGKAFTGKSFSDFFCKSALQITGQQLNLQLVRRSFAEGISVTQFPTL